MLKLFELYDRMIEDPNDLNILNTIIYYESVLCYGMFCDSDIYKDMELLIHIVKIDIQNYDHIRAYVGIRVCCEKYKKWLDDPNYKINHIFPNMTCRLLQRDPYVNFSLYGVYPYGLMKYQRMLLKNHIIYARDNFLQRSFNRAYKNVCIAERISKYTNNKKINKLLKELKHTGTFHRLNLLLSDLNEFINKFKHMKKPKILKNKFYHDMVIIVKN